MRRVLVVLLALVVAAVLAVSYFGLVQVPVVSAAFGMDHARDLGMQSDRTAFEAFADKWGIKRPSPVQNYTLNAKHHWSGSVTIDDTISEAALGSLREFTQENPYFHQISFRLHDGYAEVAAWVSVPNYPLSGPAYGQFSLDRTSSRSVAVHISQLEFGRVGVPGEIVKQVEDALNTYLNKTILDAGITIDAVELKEGGIHFKGTWPTQVTVDAPSPDAVP